ncbi:MAG: class II aldolase/adducin family protein [Gammaproteobacteria bacterium]
MSTQELHEQRLNLSAALRLAARFGLNEGIDNHFSVMLSDSTFLVNRWGVHWSRMTSADVLQLDSNGTVLSGTGTVERTAFVIHSEVHRHCPDAKAILHTHMPCTTAIACTTGRFEPISQNALRFYGRVYYDEAYAGVANDIDEGTRLAHAARHHPIVLMRHHGVMVTGPSIALAFDDLYFLERTAQVQLLAESGPRSRLSRSDAPGARFQPAVGRQPDNHLPSRARAFDQLRRQRR